MAVALGMEAPGGHDTLSSETVMADHRLTFAEALTVNYARHCCANAVKVVAP